MDYNKELLGWFQRKKLKYTNPAAYRNQKFIKSYLEQTEHVPLNVPQKTEYSFKHSGNAGDIIYALPTLKALAKEQKASFYLSIDQPANYKGMMHPLGNVMLNKGMVDRLEPLLAAQQYISEVKVHNGEAIDYDFDWIRRYPFMHNAGSIGRWYFYFFAMNADLGQPWLHVKPNNKFSNCIVVARSSRYRQALIDYSFLNDYPNVVFVGLPDEFEDMKKSIPTLNYVSVNNFLELAEVIAGSKLFIGNQSFPFSIAEGLKVKRVLEVYIPCPNVIVEGKNGYDFIYQPQFEKLVHDLVS
jgi:hypothetical protein